MIVIINDCEHAILTTLREWRVNEFVWLDTLTAKPSLKTHSQKDVQKALSYLNGFRLIFVEGTRVCLTSKGENAMRGGKDPVLKLQPPKLKMPESREGSS